PGPTSNLSELIRCLETATTEDLRRELVSVLGEWGDGSAVLPIRKVLETSPDPVTQRACVNALMTLGGPEAIKALRWAERQGGEAFGRAATWAREELETGGTLDYSEGTTVRARRYGRGTPSAPLGREPEDEPTAG